MNRIQICLFVALIASSSLLISADPGSNYGYGQTEYTNGHPSSSSSFKSNTGSGQPIAGRPNTGQTPPYAPQNARPAYDRNQNGMQADYVPAGSGSSSYQYRNQQDKRSIAPQYYSAAADPQHCSDDVDDATAAPLLQAPKNIWAPAAAPPQYYSAPAPPEPLQYNSFYILRAAPATPQYYPARPVLAAPRYSSSAAIPQYHSVQTEAADEPCN
ncbi:testis-specific gene A8 protein-like [Rhopalosiphum padi]|uniref:testis-specific gene A8 protein-like n=1 Tax=Rhopalosiphum padi TaxID=40932 RepID=UPI00298D6DB7|nr:testis-specific gene A8 protein-like [Rhopalosiphum padi]